LVVEIEGSITLLIACFYRRFEWGYYRFFRDGSQFDLCEYSLAGLPSRAVGEPPLRKFPNILSILSILVNKKEGRPWVYPGLKNKIEIAEIANEPAQLLAARPPVPPGFPHSGSSKR
jgi:hypothetical protein